MRRKVENMRGTGHFAYLPRCKRISRHRNPIRHLRSFFEQIDGRMVLYQAGECGHGRQTNGIWQQDPWVHWKRMGPVPGNSTSNQDLEPPSPYEQRSQEKDAALRQDVPITLHSTNKDNEETQNDESTGSNNVEPPTIRRHKCSETDRKKSLLSALKGIGSALEEFQ